MSSNMEIKKIVIDLGGKEISLTVDQAKKLKNLLGEMFGKEVVREIYYKDRYHYDWLFRQPNVIYTGTGQLDFDPNKHLVTCSVNSDPINSEPAISSQEINKFFANAK